MRGFGDDRAVLYLDCGGGYTILLSEFTEVYTKKVYSTFLVQKEKEDKNTAILSFPRKFTGYD